MTTLAARTAVVAAASTAPVASARKENPREKAAIDRGLEEVRVERVRVDGLVRRSSYASFALLRGEFEGLRFEGTFSNAKSNSDFTREQSMQEDTE